MKPWENDRPEQAVPKGGDDIPICPQSQGTAAKTGVEASVSETLDLAPRRPLLFEIAAILLRVAEVGALIGVSTLVVLFQGYNFGQVVEGDYFGPTMIGAIFYFGLAEVTGAYDLDVRFSVRAAWSRLLTAWFAASMFMMTLSFFLHKSEDFSRGWALSWFLLGGLMLCVVRAGSIIWMRRLRRSGVFNERVAIFGAGSQGDRLARHILSSSSLTISLAGFYDDRPAERLPERETNLPVRGNLRDLVADIRAGKLDQVVVALPWSADSRLQKVVAELAVTPVRIRLAPDLASFAFGHRPIVLLDSLPLLTLFERPLSGFDDLLKRMEDMLLGGLLLILAFPILLLAAIVIKLEDGGPIFFRQPREGFNNRTFLIWKLRSMRVEATQTDHIRQATRRDPRITRIGGLLRQTSIDELPQLINVLRGEMSIVGPRPHAPSTRAGDKLFSDIISTYAARHNVKPGITGWAQISGWRGETDTEEKLLKRLEFDLYYIENWSLLFDIYIIIKTAATSFFSRRAY